ncbi:complex I NDUFA9 subunit family protein [Rubellimicrobium sp. CFH 75288]|uniref:complex I NDUFA9 subunit family protein n=1 Tax=Rubellimicrobium sp. CFH 75288 TaxID=2697034 RepID=UPI001411FB09|nr:complex I NDUFA9 subunit family protein [Rubellimicrobium sp. CFH 75288]NAZ37714.1 NAD(P)H-binding protein [Rubellimicrobium sp. CFH 75288]
MAGLVTIFGGSGFLGRYIARRLAREGWRIRVAVRRPDEALFVRTYGSVGQVVPVACNLRDDASVRTALRGAEAAVNCVGTFDRRGRNGFDAIHVEGAGRAARLALGEGVRRFVHVSAIGADAAGPSLYARSKARGEEAVLAQMPDATILRPSILFGTEDQFFNRFARMATRSPVLPVVGARTRFQPVFVDDVAHVAALAAAGTIPSGLYELGGPEVLTFREMMERMLRHIRRRRLIVNLPFVVARPMGSLFDALALATGGLVKGPITRDQVESLRVDNVVPPGARGFEALGLVPTALDAVLPDYLWRFRPRGQYEALRDSARGLDPR